MVTDGGTYRVSQSIRVPAGLEPILYTYWSVRDRKRVGGTVTIKNHFDAFQSYGMKLGTEQDYQILAIEGYYSSGNADITLHHDP